MPFLVFKDVIFCVANLLNIKNDIKTKIIQYCLFHNLIYLKLQCSYFVINTKTKTYKKIDAK